MTETVPLHHRPLMRAVSLLLALTLSVVILINPHALIAADGTADHGVLTVLLLAICLSFIHGVGFAPHRVLWREIFGPLVSWPLLVFGLYYMIAN